MNILVVSSYMPYPLHSGGDVRLYNLLKRLSKKHTITLVCEKRVHQTKKDIEELEKFCSKVYTVERKKQWSVSTICKTVTSSKHSFLITGHTLPEMKALIRELLEEQRFDVIHVETSYVLQNVPDTSIPIVLIEHNIEYNVYQKYTDTASFLLRPFFQKDVDKLRKEEESFWKRATKVVTVSEQDAEVVAKHGLTPSVVPNGVDIEFFRQKPLSKIYVEKEKRLLFIGNYKWIQNLRSLDFILKDIWPKIEERTDPSVKLWIVGRDLPDEYQRYKSDRVIIEGVSKRSTPDIFSDAFLLLAPLVVAGGTQYKILESMAVGTPVITTKLGAAGLGIRYTKTILTGETPDEIAGHVVPLLDDERYYQVLSKNSRNHITKHFSFDSIAEKLEQVYHGVVKK